MTLSVSDVVLIDVVLRLDLKSIVLSLLTPSIFDKVTSINLSTAKPSTSVVDLKMIWNLDRRSDETSKDEWTQTGLSAGILNAQYLISSSVVVCCEAASVVVTVVMSASVAGLVVDTSGASLVVSSL